MVQHTNSDNQLSMVGWPVCSILLNMSIPNAESEELANGITILTQQCNHELQRNFLNNHNIDNNRNFLSTKQEPDARSSRSYIANQKSRT